MSLKVLYEDNHLLCVVKPVNMPVQADSSGDPDLLNLCKAYLKERYEKPGEVYLGLVHRLDRPVGGVMVFARTSKAAARLAEQMKKDQWNKEYRAVVCGKAQPEQVLEDFLLKNEQTRFSAPVPEGTPGAKFARLKYEKLQEREGLSLLKVQLDTGRHHQIRVQLSSRGLPLWGDARYNPAAKPGEQIALWASRLCLLHPTRKEPMTFDCPPPDSRPWNLFS
jgi:23S rRNA pseudouridine1911/1915/1917 synthase